MFDRALLALPRAKLALALLTLCALVQAGTIVGQALALAAALSGIWAGATFADQALFVLVFIGCYAGCQVLLYVRDTLIDRYARVRAAELRDRMLRAIFQGSASLAAREGSPVLADTAIQGVDQVESYIRIILPKMAGLLAVTLPVLVCVFVLDWVSGVILLVLLPVTALFMVLIGRSARARAARQYKSYQVLSNHFIDTLRGIRTLRAFGVARRYADVVFAVSERFRRATMRTIGLATLSTALLDLITTCGVAAVSIMLGFRLLDGSLALFTGLAVLVLAPEYFKPIREFASDFHASLDGKNALAAILRIVGQGHPQEEINGKEIESAEESPRLDSSKPISRPLILEQPLTAVPMNRLWDAQSRLSLCNVAFSYEDGAASALHDITLEFGGCERVAIIGPSGAGKSTLVDILGGFKMPTAGEIEWNGRPLTSLDDPAWQSQIIYIPQHPYIFHATLRDNIAFYQPAASPERVWEAVRAMGLEQLVAELPDGLDTVIGEGGRRLSGGQAHRIALARAFLDPARRILLLDEPTAHLDIETELELKQRMLPLMEGRLVIFATHRLHWLSDMDRVIRIEGGCTVRATEGDLSGGACRTPSPAKCQNAVVPEDEQGVQSIEALKSEWDAHDHTTELHHDAPSDLEQVGESGDPSRVAAAGAGAQDRRWIGAYVRGNRKLLVGACALGVAAFVCASMLMFCAGYVIGYTAEPDALLFALMMPMAFVQLFGAGKPIARYIQRLISHDWVFRITSDLRRRLYLAAERIVGADGDSARNGSGDSVSARTSGDYLSLLSEDIGHLQNLFLRVMLPIAIALALAVLLAVVCAFVGPALAGMSLAAMVLAAVLAPMAVRRAGRTRAAEAKRLTARLYDALTDNVMGSADWVFSGRGAEFCESNAREEAKLRALQASLRNQQRIAQLSITLLFGALACATMAWAATHFGSGPGAGGNWVIAFTLAVFPLVESCVGLPEAAQSADNHLDSLDRLRNAGAAESEEDESPSEAVRRTGANSKCAADGRRPQPVEVANPHQPCLAFENVSFAYAGEARGVLDGITLDIPAGQKIAILGRSGAGKSTLLTLARGELRPKQGAILVDGMPIEQLADVSQHIAVVEQDAYLFNQTLRQNVVLTRDAIDDEDVREALAAVGLGPLLDSLPQGLDTLMGEMGSRFSGGERQRIALARVLLSPSPLVLFDEPSVGLDPANEHTLFDAIFTTLADRTLVVVTHHLLEADRFDRIVFIEDGRIVLDGAPSNLERDSARYRQLLAFDQGRAAR